MTACGTAINELVDFGYSSRGYHLNSRDSVPQGGKTRLVLALSSRQ